ncbi:MAG: menaquinone biosynthesis protein [Nitrospinaceae bacterium]
MVHSLLRFGLHDFLNAQPLRVPLAGKGEQAGLELVTDVPSALAEKLESGQLDLAMIPAIEYLHRADAYRLLPGISIASRGEVNTVLLVTKVPLSNIHSLAVDSRSRTSAALLKLLFADEFPPDVAFRLAPPDLESMLQHHDAALIIGDQAFRVRDSLTGVAVFDLSAEWFQRTGKTFVHAVIAVRQNVAVDPGTVAAIRQFKREGVERIDAIAAAYADRNGLEKKMCEDYLKRKIVYDLGEKEQQGLLHFRDLCHLRGLLPQKFPLRWVDEE